MRAQPLGEGEEHGVAGHDAGERRGLVEVEKIAAEVA
jgi:hypothetical protein